MVVVGCYSLSSLSVAGVAGAGMEGREVTVGCKRRTLEPLYKVNQRENTFLISTALYMVHVHVCGSPPCLFKTNYNHYYLRILKGGAIYMVTYEVDVCSVCVWVCMCSLLYFRQTLTNCI